MTILLLVAKFVTNVLFIGCGMIVALAYEADIDGASMGRVKLGFVARFVVLLIAPAMTILTLFFGDRGDTKRWLFEVWQLVIHGTVRTPDRPYDDGE